MDEFIDTQLYGRFRLSFQVAAVSLGQWGLFLSSIQPTVLHLVAGRSIGT